MSRYAFTEIGRVNGDVLYRAYRDGEAIKGTIRDCLSHGDNFCAVKLHKGRHRIRYFGTMTAAATWLWRLQ